MSFYPTLHKFVAMHELRYPIGIQDFRKIRNDNYVYVDKTRMIHQLITSGVYFFLSRPRRFGKSLLLNTIKEIFSGSKDLFEGLWIADQWDWSQKRPVIKLSFANIGHKNLGLEPAIQKALDEIAVEYGLKISEVSIDQRFKELLKTLATRDGKVVLLVDEYDKPIIDYLGEDAAKAQQNREVIKTFYSVIKDADDLLQFVCITGVSKFSKVSIFSDLNNLNDISLHPTYSTLVGITQDELEQYFGAAIAQKEKGDIEIRAKLRNWYNGYTWDAQRWVYNPFSILSFLESGTLRNYWFETGTPTFLVESIRNAGHYNLNEEDFVSLLSLSSFDLAQPEFNSILFQTGYLTFSEVNFEEDWCKLRYPNREVKQSLEQLLMDAYKYEKGTSLPSVLKLRQALVQNDLPQVINIINSIFASIPSDLWQKASELHYHALIHLAFNLLGTYLRSQVQNAIGLCDAIVETESHIYVFEFKLDQSAEIALNQIFERDYLGPYQADLRKKVAIGLNFSSTSKSVEAHLVREVE